MNENFIREEINRIRDKRAPVLYEDNIVEIESQRTALIEKFWLSLINGADFYTIFTYIKNGEFGGAYSLFGYAVILVLLGYSGILKTPQIIFQEFLKLICRMFLVIWQKIVDFISWSLFQSLAVSLEVTWSILKQFIYFILFLNHWEWIIICIRAIYNCLLIGLYCVKRIIYVLSKIKKSAKYFSEYFTSIKFKKNCEKELDDIIKKSLSISAYEFKGNSFYLNNKVFLIF